MRRRQRSVIVGAVIVATSSEWHHRVAIEAILSRLLLHAISAADGGANVMVGVTNRAMKTELSTCFKTRENTYLTLGQQTPAWNKNAKHICFRRILSRRARNFLKL